MTAAPGPEAGPTVLLEDVGFAWERGGAGFRLDIPELALASRTRTLLVGPSGSGKSTLLGLLCGTLTPERGRILVEGTDIAALPGAKRDRLRAERIGLVFQMFNLVPYLGIAENVTLPLRFAPQRRARVEAAGGPKAEARRLLLALGLDPETIGRPVSKLSVGQQQRVAAARALIGAPALIVADEPTSALDRDRQDGFLDLLFQEVEAAGATLLMVSHETRFAERFDATLDLAALTGRA
ncbi:MAG: ATP-binding cassette domain-containing protein [Pseudomonadota bacterium]